MPHPRIEVERWGGLGVARVARRHGVARLGEPWPSSPMDGPVDASAPNQRLVGRRHDRIDALVSDIAQDDLDPRPIIRFSLTHPPCAHRAASRRNRYHIPKRAPVSLAARDQGDPGGPAELVIWGRPQHRTRGTNTDQVQWAAKCLAPCTQRVLFDRSCCAAGGWTHRASERDLVGGLFTGSCGCSGGGGRGPYPDGLRVPPDSRGVGAEMRQGRRGRAGVAQHVTAVTRT